MLDELLLTNSDDVLLTILTETDVENPSPLSNRSHFDFSHLQKLSMNVSRNIISAVWRMIHRARASLRDLTLQQSYMSSTLDAYSCDTSFPSGTASHPGPHPLPEYVSLFTLTCLHHLSLAIVIQDHMCPPHPRLFSSWCSLLRTAPPSISTLDIKLDFFFLRSIQCLRDWFILERSGKAKTKPCPLSQPSSDILTSDSTSLTELDETISSAVLFPHLESVTIEIQLPDDAEVESTGEDEDEEGFDDDEDGDDNSNDDRMSWGATGSHNYSTVDPYPVTFDEVKMAVNRMMKLTRRRLRASKSFHVSVGFGQGLDSD
ncbi:hypothetical protein BDZ97DRAFT_538825 [Flammula alnicola]|nr:hypothetical protein BDZ97DRAFT_538825 [Flammula alnicola]